MECGTRRWRCFPARVRRRLGQPRDRETEGKVHLRLRDPVAVLGKRSNFVERQRNAETTTVGVPKLRQDPPGRHIGWG